MIHRISKQIANFLLFNNVINKDEIDVYIYGYEVMISSLIDFMIVLIAGILSNELFANANKKLSHNANKKMSQF